MPVEKQDKEFVEKNIELLQHIVRRIEDIDNTVTAQVPSIILLATVINRFEEKLDDVNNQFERTREELCGELHSLGEEASKLRDVNDAIYSLEGAIRAQGNKG